MLGLGNHLKSVQYHVLCVSAGILGCIEVCQEIEAL